MKNLNHLTAIICAVLSGYLAYHGGGGWGWFLFATVIIACNPAKWEKNDDQRY